MISKALSRLLLPCLMLLMASDAVAQKVIVLDVSPQIKEIRIDDLKFRVIKVEGGKFKMTERYIVTLDTFYIGQTEVTQELWKAVMKKNPSEAQGYVNYPVENVSWNNCQKFIKKLNELTGLKFRLPTEAEWTYAAIGGKSSKGYAYSGGNVLEDVAWFRDNVDSYINWMDKNGGRQRVMGNTVKPRIHEVATRLPNELGLFDMCGNVSEWCSDYFADELPTTPQTNPTGPKQGDIKVFKGGGWKSTRETCAISYRAYDVPYFSHEDLGLRLVLEP
ncbi:MAG: formylglycine-generating enzyme family protein [Bacteroidaceae bacterium]|nr:formylglycine-generating enzyme family protein [Bacteroidaceae bacterium]